MKKVFTTGQVAKICKVAPRTVSKWFDSGRLRGYRIPGSQDRRIPREHLIKFLKEHGMPLGELEEEGLHKILIIGAEKIFIDRIKDLLPEDDDYKYELASSGFEAGIQAESFHPDTIIIDLAMGRSEALQISQNLRRNPQYEQTLIIALASEDEAAPETLVNYGFSEAFKKPFDVALLGERIRTLVEEKRENMSGKPRPRPLRSRPCWRPGARILPGRLAVCVLALRPRRAYGRPAGAAGAQVN